MRLLVPESCQDSSIKRKHAAHHMRGDKRVTHHVVRLHRVLLVLIAALQGETQRVDDPQGCEQGQEVEDCMDVILHHEAATYHRE